MTHGENVAYQSHLLEAVHPDSTFRADCEKISQTSNKFLDDLSLNRGVFDALKSVDVSNADSATQYFMMRTLRDFRRAGVDKDEPTRKEIAGNLRGSRQDGPGLRPEHPHRTRGRLRSCG